VTAADFAEIYEALRHRAEWGEQDRRGALNHINPADVVAAAGSVSIGHHAGSPGAGCCSIYLGCAGSTGWVQAIMSSPPT